VLFDIIGIMSVYVITKHDADVPLSSEKKKGISLPQRNYQFYYCIFLTAVLIDA
jgi:hypothetical protein